MIDVIVTTDKHTIKSCRLMQSMKSIRLIIPKDWDCDMVNILLWDDESCELKIGDPEMYEFRIPNCGEILLKKIIRDDRRQYTYIPAQYDGQQVLIVPV